MIAEHDPTQIPGTVRWVGFIRNVMTGREGLTAQRLIDIVAASGGRRPASHRGTGNVAFDAHPSDLDSIIERLEQGIADVISRHEPVFVRNLDDLRRTADTNPFAHTPISDVHERCVTYLQTHANGFGPLPVHSRRGDLVVFEIDDLDVYSVTTLVHGRATSPGPLLERTSGAPATSRNWSTIEYILSKETTTTQRTPQWT